MKITKNKEIISIRLATTGDALAIAEVRCNAIQNIAATYYDRTALEEWAGPVEERVPKLLSNSADVRIVVERNDQIVGYGELVTNESLIGACYVSSEVGRRGVGKAIVAELERIAREKQLTHLQMESSMNAEQFYISCGYQSIERGKHTMRNGTVMGCVMMRKDL